MGRVGVHMNHTYLAKFAFFFQINFDQTVNDGEVCTPYRSVVRCISSSANIAIEDSMSVASID